LAEANVAPAAEPAIVRLDGVGKRFGPVRALEAVNLEVRRGEYFSLLGASGCGKTTLLRIVAGLEQPDFGRVILDGVDMTRTPAYLRPVNTVFQSYALFPHMTVARNVAFGLRQEGMERAEIEARVAATLAQFEIEALAARRPHELSGGQRQRVALCRALVKRPKILLLDEPLAALDRRLREQARFELKGLQAGLGITFIMVTHDQDEAMSLSGRVAVMNSGRIEQVGTPRAIYDRPASRFVAGFVGDANFLDGRVLRATNGTAEVDVGAGRPIEVAATGLAVGAPVTLMLRPERIRLADREREGRCAGTVVASAFLGNASLLRVRLASGPLIEMRLPSLGQETLPEAGAAVALTWAASAPVLLSG
jgi:putrescine transport system ATP-binding protein